MNFLKLKVDNFLAIGNAAPIALDNRGLVLIQGVNIDDTSATSNGVGKSSIADALCWVLYGATARGVTGDGVINEKAGKNCMVQVMVQDGDSLYRISRYRKHKEFKNRTVVEASTTTDWTTWIDLSKGTEAETQKVIDQIMGCTLEVFMAAIYAGQEVAPDIPKMTDKTLKLLIEEAAGVERLETAYEIARRRRSVVKDELTALTAKCETTGIRIEQTKRDIEAEKLRYEAFEANRDVSAKAFTNREKTAKEGLVRVLKSMKEIDQPALQARSEEIAEILANHSKLLRQASALKDAANEANNALSNAKYKASDALNEVKKLREAFNNAEVEITKPCPSCGRPGEAHGLEDYKEHIKTKLREKVIDAKSKQDFVATCEESALLRQNEHDDFVKTIPNVSEISSEAAAINAKLHTHTSLRGDAGNLKREMEHSQELAAKAKTNPNPHEAAITSFSERLVELEALLATHTAETEVAQANFELLNNVVEIFGPAGVRAYILDTVTPFLNDRTSDYLSALSDGNISAIWTTLSATAKGELREKFMIEVSNDKGAKTFAGLSGGEKRKVRLATMLALQDLVASRASKPIQLWMGDEIDYALDGAGMERLFGILERKARERGTVLVISHTELRDWCDQVTTITKEDGQSRIEGALVL